MNLLEPTNSAEVAQLLRNHRGQELSVRGLGTRGIAPRRIGPVLCTTALDRILDLDVAEQVVTAEAGVPLATIESALADTALTLAPLVDEDSVGTLGGLFSDPRELSNGPRYGRVRDMVLGIEAVRGDGQQFKAGGRVVKNVTGYDLTRFLAGGRGRWGVVTKLHWRLQPRPQHIARWSFEFDGSDSSWEGLKRLRGLPFDPLRVSLDPNRNTLQIDDCGTERVCAAHGKRMAAALGTRPNRAQESKRPVSDYRLRAPFSKWQPLANSAAGLGIKIECIYPYVGFAQVSLVTEPAREQWPLIHRELAQHGASITPERSEGGRGTDPLLVTDGELAQQVLATWDPAYTLQGKP